MRQGRALTDEVRPFIGLAAQKVQPTDDGQPQKGARRFGIAGPGGADRHGHDGAAADQNERHEGDQHHVEHLSLFGPRRSDAAHEAIRNKKSCEGQRVRDDENPHHELAP